MADDMVYLKAKQDISIYAVPLHPFVFRPYLKLPFSEYFRWKPLFEYTGMISMVGEEEYLAWERAEAERAAELHFCGDYGGSNKKGEFCGRRVDGPGQRCEHHGGRDAELQGSYEASGWPRPEYAK